jgi:hypothetical protein
MGYPNGPLKSPLVTYTLVGYRIHEVLIGRIEMSSTVSQPMRLVRHPLTRAVARCLVMCAINSTGRRDDRAAAGRCVKDSCH